MEMRYFILFANVKRLKFIQIDIYRIKILDFLIKYRKNLIINNLNYELYIFSLSSSVGRA